MPRPLRTLARAAILLALTAAATAAPERTDKHPEYGFSLDRPSTFEERPVPTGRPGMLSTYAPKKAPLDKASPVTHSVYRFEFRGTGEVATQRWAIETFAPIELDKSRSVRRRYGRDPVRFEGTTMDENGGKRSLFVHGWVGPSDVIVFVGECDEDLWRRERRVFDRTSMTFRFFTEEELSEARQKWQRHYQRSSLPHTDRRIEIAAAAVEGWSIRDTQHSIILYHGPSDSPVLAQIASNLTAVRKRIAQDFPPDRPIDQLSVVRVCRDRGEYLTYGGNPNTVGYFQPKAGELVLYDSRTEKSEAMSDSHPTMRTLYHEACHQFLHHTASSMSPHSWYDEGSSEYYAGAQFSASGAVTSIDELEDRRRFLLRRDTRTRLPKLEALMSMTQEQFYADADVNYSMGYAFIRFLRTGEAALAKEEWRELPTTYFETLRDGWRREAERLATSGITGAKYMAAVKRSRAKALESVKKDIDLDDLEGAFLQWLVTSK